MYVRPTRRRTDVTDALYKRLSVPSGRTTVYVRLRNKKHVNETTGIAVNSNYCNSGYSVQCTPSGTVQYTLIAGTVQYQSSSTKLYLQLSLTAHLRVLSESDLAISFPVNQLPPIISSFSFTP